jgi:alkaline phosphatase D
MDTRKYDRDITDLNYNTDYVQSLAVDIDSKRSIMGPVQEKWLEDGLNASQERGTVWRLIWNQVILGSYVLET